ncbi:hypothetical protein AB0F77_11125 [Streptomyces sp. NPDC026672]|uniref:hypothetical protein n=1 Tax=unclassified Streptomyces TaxID=2593676 RepID=UPI0033FBAA97
MRQSALEPAAECVAQDQRQGDGLRAEAVHRLIDAALRPVTGADKVLRYITGTAKKANAAFTAGPATVNGNPALTLRLGGVLDGVLTFRVEDDHITGLYYVRNPEKLTRVESETPLTSR